MKYFFFISIFFSGALHAQILYAIPGATVGDTTLQPCVPGNICLSDDTVYTFTIGSVSYPPSYLKTAEDSALSALGILPVSQTTPPTGVNVLGQSIQMVNGIPTQVWKTTPYTAQQQAQTAYSAALSIGLSIISVGTPSLNGIYAIDDSTELHINSERIAISTSASLNNGQGTFTNGKITKFWPFMNGEGVTLSVAQFTIIVTAIEQYKDALLVAQTAAAAGQQVTWPSSQVQIP